MQTLVIYDDLGKVIACTTDATVDPPSGVPYLYVDVPEGRKVVSVDVSVIPNVAVLNTDPVDVVSARVDTLDADLLTCNDLVLTALEAMAQTYEAVYPFLPATND